MEDNRVFFSEVDKMLREYSSKVKKTCDELSIESSKELYEHLVMSVFLYDTSHTKCFMRIMEEKIKGMDYKVAKKVHSIRFKKIVSEASKMLLLGKEDIEDRINLDEEKNLLGEELKEILKNLSKGTKSFTLKDFVNFHRVIIKAIIEPQLKGTLLGEEGKNKFLALAEDKFVKAFGRHYGFLECGKHKE